MITPRLVGWTPPQDASSERGGSATPGLAFAHATLGATRRSAIVELDSAAGTLILREFGPHHWRERHWRIAEIREVVVREHTMAGIPLRLAEGAMADFLILSRRQARGGSRLSSIQHWVWAHRRQSVKFVLPSALQYSIFCSDRNYS